MWINERPLMSCIPFYPLVVGGWLVDNTQDKLQNKKAFKKREKTLQ